MPSTDFPWTRFRSGNRTPGVSTRASCPGERMPIKLHMPVDALRRSYACSSFCSGFMCRTITAPLL
jgi:hypothetical protein